MLAWLRSLVGKVTPTLPTPTLDPTQVPEVAEAPAVSVGTPTVLRVAQANGEVWEIPVSQSEQVRV